MPSAQTRLLSSPWQLYCATHFCTDSIFTVLIPLAVNGCHYLVRWSAQSIIAADFALQATTSASLGIVRYRKPACQGGRYWRYNFHPALLRTPSLQT